ncbi:NADP-dependent oxidoreductase [Pedobacter cryoconitis]|uniref:Enoyl reductase (ER) domain-containing protein n=1 Tax=Pedobacter cryoconitis TaxID=188932 RepID=A0A7X0J6G2_9SPHI|nr:NADP-dependent oxidoreductase [Pedobacter cryoconitis]MBB6501974.1 hypothetical protein [Pedobacter cryoconitis]
MNNIITLDNRPVGKPQLSNFKFIAEPMPEAGQHEILLKTLYVSVDPYLRGRMNDAKSYIPPFQLHQPVQSGIIAEVVTSDIPGFSKGDFVSGNLQWKEYQVSNGKGLSKVDQAIAPLSAFLGVLGMTGLTAYLGLIEIGKPKAGETLVISGAAGAVGSIVGQIGKILGCRVVGIAGSDEKTTLLKTRFGFDEAINYKTTKQMDEAIATACPDGVDIYFDNVGGEISDAVMANLNRFARVPVCGSISTYNTTEVQTGPRLQTILVTKSVLMQGFIVGQFADKAPQAIDQLAKWVKEEKLHYTETIVNGFKNIPAAFLDLFEGKNEGKMIVKI